MKKLKESDVAFLGVIITVVLYVMNVIGTGVIVGGDVGHIGTEIPFYGFVAPIIFIAFAAYIGYYTKKNSMKSAFIATYVTLALPFAAYPLAFIFNGTPLLLIPIYLCMPAGSLLHYLNDEICDLMERPIDALAASLNIEAYKVENWVIILIIAVMLVPLIVAPVVYRFTKSTEE